MAKRTPEEKLADLMAETVANHWFNPALFADILTTDHPLYTQEQIMELIKWVIKYQDRRFKDEWEHGQTTEGLLLANHLAEVIDSHENPAEHEVWTLF